MMLKPMKACFFFLASQFFIDFIAAQSCMVLDLSGGAVSSSSPTNKVNSAEGPAAVFDGDVNTKWLDYSKAGAWVQYKHPSSVEISAYSLVSGNDAPERDPLSWNFQGSKDGKFYNTLDTQTAGQWTKRGERRTFALKNIVGLNYTYFKLQINAVRDDSLANSVQLADIELHTGECNSACCGIDCGENGNCVSGKCVCNIGYEGSACESKSSDSWSKVVDSRAIIGSSLLQTLAAPTTVDACKKQCESLKSCVGITLVKGDCQIHGGPSHDMMSSTGSSSYLYVTGIRSVMKDVPKVSGDDMKGIPETQSHTIFWDSNKKSPNAIPSITIRPGEPVTFEWSDRNLLDGYLSPKGVRPVLKNENNHHSVSLFPSLDDYINCDFTRAKTLAVAPSFTWTSTSKGKFYFGSNYEDDCKVGMIKTMVVVA